MAKKNGRDDNGTEGLGHVEVQYPTMEQGMHAVRDILKHVTGSEELSNAVLINEAWVGVGAALSKVFSVEGGFGAGGEKAAKPVKVTAAQRKVLERFQDAQAKEGGPRAIDKKALLKVLLEILMKYALTLAAVLLLAAGTQAQQFEVKQAPPPVFTITQGKVDVIEGLRKELDRVEEGIKQLEADRAKTGQGFRGTVPVPPAAVADALDTFRNPPPLRNTDGVPRGARGGEHCEGGCCDEKGAPARKASGETFVTSLNGGRGELPWRDVARLSLQSRKPVLEWIGEEVCPRCVDDTDGEFLHYFTKDRGKALNVWLPGSDGEHYKVASLTGWVEGSAKWGHAASARKVLKAWNEGRATTTVAQNGKAWAAPDNDPTMGVPPDSPMWGAARTMTVAMHDPASHAAPTFRDPAFVVTPAPAPVQQPVFVQPPVMFHQPAPMMMSAPVRMAAPRMGIFRGGRRGGGCAGGSCG